MKVCGVELKGNDAILVCLEGDVSAYSMILKERKKISLNDSLDQQEVIDFASEIKSFFKAHDFDIVGIKARATKGRFSGGSVSFKMEGIIQTSETKVKLVHGATVKAKLKDKMDDLAKIKVNAYQKDALMVAVYLLDL